MIISSRNNTQVKRLRELRHRKARERTGLYCIEGVRPLAETVQLQADVDTLILAPDLLTSTLGWEVVRVMQARHVPLLSVTPEVYETLFSGSHAIGAVLRQRWQNLGQIIPARETICIVLDRIQYPGNLGTILRTSDAVGGCGVILLGDTADPYDPLSVRASMGAILSQRLTRATYAEFAAWKEAHGVDVFGTSPAASHDYRAVTYPRPTVLMMGSEGAGLPPGHEAVCDTLVSIPMVGRSDSLNVAVAAGLVLYEVFRQHSRPGRNAVRRGVY